MAVLAVLGCGKAWLGGKTKFTDYCKLPVIWKYAITLIVELALTPLLYELLRRIPVIRYLALGIKERKSK